MGFRTDCNHSSEDDDDDVSSGFQNSQVLKNLPADSYKNQ